MLGELLFGSIPLNYHGNVTKVHELKDPRRLLISSIFRIADPDVCRSRLILSLTTQSTTVESNVSSVAPIPIGSLGSHNYGAELPKKPFMAASVPVQMQRTSLGGPDLGASVSSVNSWRRDRISEPDFMYDVVPRTSMRGGAQSGMASSVSSVASFSTS